MRTRDILGLIHQFPQLFTDIPHQHSDFEHDIILIENRPIRQSPYRLNPDKREILRIELQSLLAQGLIEASVSPYASPCLLVPKPDESQGLVVDFRKLKAITKADAHPLPGIDDLIDFVEPSKFVTKIDLLKGYHQISLHPNAPSMHSFLEQGETTILNTSQRNTKPKPKHLHSSVQYRGITGQPL